LSKKEKAFNAFARALDLTHDDLLLQGEVLNNKVCCRWFNGDNKDDLLKVKIHSMLKKSILNLEMHHSNISNFSKT